MNRNPVDHGYAVLGLPRGSSERVAARRYRLLVKRWHPDQYANDPQGFAEATIRMRAINDAYAAVKAAGLPRAVTDQPRHQEHSSHQTPSQHSHLTLTPEQIDEIAKAVGTRSFVDEALNILGWVWPFPFAFIFWSRVVSPGRHLPLRPTEQWWPLMLVALGVVLWIRQALRSRNGQ